MSRPSEASPVYGAEQLSGKITDSCYSHIDKPGVITLTEDDVKRIASTNSTPRGCANHTPSYVAKLLDL